MANNSQKENSQISTKAWLLETLRKNAGNTLSGTLLASELGISRVSIWKGIQSLIIAGYPIEALDSGYVIHEFQDTDFLYPWEFLEKESLFSFIDSTASIMDLAREAAQRGALSGSIFIAEKQSKGRGRNGKTWVSEQGGLYFSVLEKRPQISIADYCLPMMLYQIALARTLTGQLGKEVNVRWPNDIYVDKRKIAGLYTEFEGEGDSVKWLSIGIGVNVNNPAPFQKAASCIDILGKPLLRRRLLLVILDEAERLKKDCKIKTIYSQGNRFLSSEWNLMTDCLGNQAAVVISDARIIFEGKYCGIDPAGRCIIKPHDGKGALYFNPGRFSINF